MKEDSMNISIDTGKIFDKVQYPFTIKTLRKLEIEGNFHNMIRSIYENSTANILNDESLKGFPLRSRVRHECPFSLLLINTILEILARAIREEKEKTYRLERKR
uniref:Reverse transcriptase domain-containing protein n=1 Tax=Sus scrofa TaxID=9823 RepID=A0A8D1G393_PIG